MFAQLFLGINFIVIGIVQHYSKKPSFFLSEDVIQRISKKELPCYLRRVGKAFVALGILFITMGQIEYHYNPEISAFIVTDIILGLACILNVL